MEDNFNVFDIEPRAKDMAAIAAQSNTLFHATLGTAWSS